MKDEKQTLPLGFYSDFQSCLVFTLFLSVSLRQSSKGKGGFYCLLTNAQTGHPLSHLSYNGGGPLPFSEFSADDGGLVSSRACRLSISAFFVSTSCWRLLTSTCGGGGRAQMNFAPNSSLHKQTPRLHVCLDTQSRDLNAHLEPKQH